MPNYVSQLPNVNYPYVNIVFGALSGNPFSITSEAFGSNRPKYFMDLTHKIITRQAAEMTISVSFVPNMSYDSVDADSFEMEIVSRMGLCTVEYGHNIDNTITYWVMLTDYDIGFNNGVITYSFKGISQSVLFNSSMISIKYPCTGYTKGTADDFLNYLKKFIENNSQTNIYNGSRTEYTLDINNCTKNFKVPNDPKEPINVSQYSLIGALQKLVSELEIKNPENDTFLTLVVDDRYISDDTPKKIKIVECSTKSKEDASLSFRWNNPDDGVLNFSVQYQGIMAMARARADASNDKDLKNGVDKLEASLLGSDGKPKKITTYGITDALGNKLMLANLAQVDCATARSKNYWTRYANYPYKANLTVLGNIDPSIELASIIHIDVLLGVSKHHTSGNYMVLGITDSVGSKGFTTEYELLKLYSENDYFSQEHMITFGKAKLDKESSDFNFTN